MYGHVHVTSCKPDLSFHHDFLFSSCLLSASGASCSTNPDSCCKYAWGWQDQWLIMVDYCKWRGGQVTLVDSSVGGLKNYWVMKLWNTPISLMPLDPILPGNPAAFSWGQCLYRWLVLVGGSWSGADACFSWVYLPHLKWIWFIPFQEILVFFNATTDKDRRLWFWIFIQKVGCHFRFKSPQKKSVTASQNPDRPDRGATRCADMTTPFGGMGVPCTDRGG